MKNLTESALAWLCTLLKERYGHDFIVERADQHLHLRLADKSEDYRSIIFPVMLPCFNKADSDFPCGHWDARDEGFSPALDEHLATPGLANPPIPLVEQQGNNVVIHYDILGFTYWMLSRLEEVGRNDLDNHGRFPAASSHAFKYGYLERPIVDEWLHVLGQVIQRVWPLIELKRHRFSMKVSHDVDNPSRYAFSSFASFMRSIAGDILKHRNFKRALLAPWVRLNTKQQLHIDDPFNTFDWLMDISDENNLQSAFYFICGRTDPSKDSDYEPEHPVIRELMRRIHRRGHEVGLHPSYDTYQAPELIRQEAARLKDICAEEGIYQEQWGGRMHFLRWQHPTTLQAWEDAGMAYDTTLGYADHPGFRCGTCFEYPAFNPQSQQALELRIRPLIVMESTIIAERYMGLAYTQGALEKFQELKGKCKAVNGMFTLLWHNSHFMSQDDFLFYKDLVIK
ncbi:hypothetical protein DHB74_00360 [Pseudomonas sp. G11-1]|nr:hypothetical protein [Pseudomonas sp. G11-1]MCO5789094.1 hypothetical protein [Pseudomonas sp. G11-2]